MGSLLSICFEDEERGRREDEAEVFLVKRRRVQDSWLSLVCVGVLGSGRSSFLNTVLDSSDACKVSGGQLRGTRGFTLLRHQLKDGPGPSSDIDLIDTEGLRSDQTIRAEELEIYLSGLFEAMKLLPGSHVSHLVYTLDVEDRQNGPSIANLLILTQALSKAKDVSFLCLTKWNSNAVKAQWNRKLLSWVRANRKAKTIDELKDIPPSQEDMLDDYVAYIEHEFNTPTEKAALDKMRQLLDFFKSRVIFAYNLDNMQREDRAEGDLAPYEEYLYRFYRKEVLTKLFQAAGRAADVQTLLGDTEVHTLAQQAVQSIAEKFDGTLQAS